MKTYLLFCGPIFYPEGGASDLRGDYDTLEEVLNALEEFKKERREQGSDYIDAEFWEYHFAHCLNTSKSEITTLGQSS